MVQYIVKQWHAPERYHGLAKRAAGTDAVKCFGKSFCGSALTDCPSSSCP
jgi:hypothetical protein